MCGRDCTSERLRTVINAIKKHRVVSLSVLEQVMDMLHSRFLSNIMDAVVPVVLFPTTASFQRVNHGVARIPIPVRPEPCPNPANYVHHTCRCEKLSLFTSESRRTHFLPRSLLSTLHSCFILSSLAYSSPFHTITTDATTRCWARITLHSSLCSTPLALTCPTSSYGHCTYTALYHPLRYTTDLPFSLYTVLSGLTHWLSSSLTRSPHVESGYK